ncbi:Sec23/Sec24 trunk domain-domain-containing protein [Yarrowia lipolytica]|jgi:protein transport protein SEC24|uniref:YALI0E14036p n=2 Tax=Yarrowia lipolytica TaxID=4952 RepID=Q6C5Y6_YARLI|nr:YALI0E14036p [Yarrowia lipolytica CLIB122]AOW05398.1 hypothetical protein YALI1_E17069g [Yarrowia lipolytica]KAB8282100.1 Sec23/Sec24 trunk domain-containing protein [Yarrowia lipolytica]KAE8171146.1 Sec23/Sec24 trunk domain-containing protein [Yarrowia lipolytica]KAJ8056906.1 Sec23/Sec24 trunk domain-containing protein [Yarrowia lipolytica]RDW28741.1 Sec23/Sec24 trunk domain-domain-containing protein [Yarrowia lipolytica]|eukprot:XP_503926.1 YALI0E14036p [Yarrowia lipolytica CLIB122]
MASKKRSARAFHDLGADPNAPNGNPLMSPDLSQPMYGVPPAGQVAADSPYGGAQFGYEAHNPAIPHGQPAYGHAASPAVSHGAPLAHSFAQMSLNASEQEGFGHDAANPSLERGNQGIPSLAARRNDAREYTARKPVFKTFQNTLPPPATAEYLCEDQGVSAPPFCRLSMYNVPVSDQLRSLTKLPLGMVVKPFAERDVPVADFSQIEPFRCRRCMAFINPQFLFSNGGSRAVCNMCQFPNAVPGEYFQPTDHNGARVDVAERAELFAGTYDMVVPDSYYPEGDSREPVKHLFVIDVSDEAIKKELPSLAAEAIRKALDEDDTPKKIGIITFDHALQFYNLNADLEKPHMVVSNDLKDPFVPFEDGLFVDAQESRHVIEDLLPRLQSMFEGYKYAESAFGAAVSTAHKVLSAFGGGKAHLVLGSTPTWGPGSVFPNNLENRKTASKEPKNFDCKDPFYTELAGKYAKDGVGLDVFVMPSSVTDLVTLGYISAKSGGTTKHYPNFVPIRDGKRFMADLAHSVTSLRACGAKLKVRCSTGLQVAAYYGSFHSDDWHIEPDVGSVDSDSTYGILFSYDGKLDTKLDAHFQTSLLYKHLDGTRRLRVINVLAGVTEQFKPAINFVDADACFSIMARNLFSKVTSTTLKEARFGLNERLVEVFASYRKNTTEVLPATQLLLPTSLRPLLIQSLALLKSPLLRDTVTSLDRRIQYLREANNSDVDKFSYMLYPYLFALHNMREIDGSAIENGHFVLPDSLAPSLASLEEGGAYMLFNGEKLYLWLPSTVSPQLLNDLFGEDNNITRDLDPYMNSIPEVDSHINKQVRALVAHFEGLLGISHLNVQLCRPNLDGAEMEFQSLLVEDRNMGEYAYTDFVSHIHRHVKLMMENSSMKMTSKTLLNDAIGYREAGL